AIAWLPGHALAGSSVDAAAAHTSPWRLTTAAHSIFPENRPPASPSTPGAVRNNVFSSLADGRSRHIAASAPDHGGLSRSGAAPGWVSAGDCRDREQPTSRTAR